MAFAVGRDRFTPLRDSLRAVVEAGDVEPMRWMWNQHRARTMHERNNVRFRVESSHLLALCSEGLEAAHALNIVADVSPVLTWLKNREVADLAPPSWLALAAGWEIGSQAEALLREGGERGRFIATSRVQTLTEALAGLPSPIAMADAPRGPQSELGWLRSLKFREASSDRWSARVTDPATDIVLVPDEANFYDHEPTPSSLLDAVRDRLALGDMLEATTGPFMLSEGPGPFLPTPPMAEPVEAPTWKRLPLFDVSHWNWPLLDVHVLYGAKLEHAAAWALDVAPERAWHDRFNVEPIDESLWQDAISEYWPRCRDRFVGLLRGARRQEQVVLLLGNDLSHPCWPGALWPTRVLHPNR